MNIFLKSQKRYFQWKVKKLSYKERLIWADNHPKAKKLLGIKGFNDLSILEKASFCEALEGKA